MKITNATSKKITLLSGKTINPQETIIVDVKKGTDLYEQILKLNDMGLLDLS